MAQSNFDQNSPDYWGRQLKFWIGFLILFVAVMWLFSPILLPFVLGIVVAYLLNPVVNKLETWKLSRTLSTIIILGGFIVFVFGGISILFPIVSAEILKLIKGLPDYFSQAWEMTASYRQALEQRLGEEEMAQIKSTIESSSGKILELSQNFLDGLISSGQAMISFVSVMVIMPIVAFYMMIEWPTITKKVDSYIPKHHSETVHDILTKIDMKLSGFIRGQFLVAFVLGLLYASAMKIAGLNFGLIIGLMAGILSIIPLVGSTIGLLTGAAVAYFQTYDIGFVALIAGIFFAGQLFEGNFLTPKLVGDRVGLHPLWVLFALMAGGALFGFVGVLVAVPVAAVISVFVAFALDQYKRSEYYARKNGTQTQNDKDSSSSSDDEQEG